MKQPRRGKELCLHHSSLSLSLPLFSFICFPLVIILHHSIPLSPYSFHSSFSIRYFYILSFVFVSFFFISYSLLLVFLPISISSSLSTFIFFFVSSSSSCFFVLVLLSSPMCIRACVCVCMCMDSVEPRASSGSKPPCTRWYLHKSILYSFRRRSSFVTGIPRFASRQLQLGSRTGVGYRRRESWLSPLCRPRRVLARRQSR